VFDLPAKRELNRGFGDALSTAFELAVTPAIVALIGWRLDAWLGTTPVFLVALFAFTMSYEIWKLFRRYDAQMRDHEARVPGLRRPDAEEPGP
jgi:F0F1-type ATP synthase assembly protein I